jgi:hypothetical protein
MADGLEFATPADNFEDSIITWKEKEKSEPILSLSLTHLFRGNRWRKRNILVRF